ncbi:MAG: hypothetical protein DME45_08350 [Verrucomicrobia bacterium]|nr:MAG: hypothetical protein DME45_08350 [Verrucomicrobiota bacterium]PYK75553.1 MAG: hypothetical protein DME42_02245 [Verrucomicrobiota bacterium]
MKSLGMPDSELIKEIEHLLVSSTCGPLRAIGLNFFPATRLVKKHQKERRNADTAWHIFGPRHLKVCKLE